MNFGHDMTAWCPRFDRLEFNRDIDTKIVPGRRRVGSKIGLMAYFHWPKRTRIYTGIPNPMATLYYTEIFSQILIPNLIANYKDGI